MFFSDHIEKNSYPGQWLLPLLQTACSKLTANESHLSPTGIANRCLAFQAWSTEFPRATEALRERRAVRRSSIASFAWLSSSLPVRAYMSDVHTPCRSPILRRPVDPFAAMV